MTNERSTAPAKTVAQSGTIFSQSMMPADANPYGNVHGGEIMKLIDSCAGAAAARHARGRVVTARIDELSFLAPVLVGDLVVAMASVNEVGATSMEVGVRVEAENTLTGESKHVASAYLVFVAIDAGGHPVPIPPLVAETDQERRRMAQAKQRRALRLQRPRG
ncbi:MAG: acyl-CoA thioesterase [Candidatus Limnocylindria bacterium]|nr:acyl-CoA thioesterase [Candidatus Limnocylindria bacterium]